MDLLLQSVIAAGSLVFLVFIGLVFFLGRWAHQRHGLTAGYWIAGCILWSRFFGLASPWATERLVNGFMGSGPAAVPLGQLVALGSYAQLILGSMGQLVLAILLGAELVHRLGPQKDRRDPGLIAWLGGLQSRRTTLGLCAFLLYSIHPLAAVGALLLLGAPQ